MENNKMLFDDAEVLENNVISKEAEKEEEENEDETPDEAAPVQE